MLETARGTTRGLSATSGWKDRSPSPARRGAAGAGAAVHRISSVAAARPEGASGVTTVVETISSRTAGAGRRPETSGEIQSSTKH